MSIPNRNYQSGFTRRLISLAVLFGVCAMVVPMPVALPPQESSEKDRSEAFPCQNRPCGCRSAAQCWKKCCCFTNTQKVAWAKANRVKIPDFVLIAAADEEKEERKSDEEICSNVVNKPPQKTCSACKTKPQLKPSATRSGKYVMAVFAAECMGQGPFAFSFLISVNPDPVTVVTGSVIEMETLAVWSDRLQQYSLRPPLPPPKIV